MGEIFFKKHFGKKRSEKIQFAKKQIAWQVHPQLIAKKFMLFFWGFAYFFSLSIFSISAQTTEQLQILPYNESYSLYERIGEDENSADDNKTSEEPNEESDLEKTVLKNLRSFYRSYFKRKEANELAVNFDLPFDFTPTENWSSNKRRLYIRELFDTEQKKYLLAEAPNMFYAHFALAKKAVKNAHYEKAALHLSQAMRFRTLKMSESLLLNQQKNTILGNSHPQVIFANAYATAKQNWINDKRDLKNKKRRYYVLYDKSFAPIGVAKITREETDELKNLKSEIPELEKKVEQERLTFLQFKKDFIPIQKTYNKESADFLEFFIEAMVRQDERVRTLQKSAYQMHQYTRNYSPVIPEVMPEKQDLRLQDEIYTKMLQLDPNRSAAWIKLGEINYLRGDYQKSLSSYAAATQILESTKEEIKKTENPNTAQDKQEEIQETNRILYATYKKLSAVSLLEKKYPQAAFYLNKAFVLQNENEQIDAQLKEANLIQLSRIYSRYIGNYSEAFRLLSPLAENIVGRKVQETLDEQSINDSSLRTDMLILNDYALAAQKTKRFAEFERAKLKGIAIHQSLLRLLNQVYDEEKQVDAQMKTLRASMNSETNSDMLAQYSQKKMQLENIRKRQQKILATRNSLPVYDFYLSLALYYQTHGSLYRARDILQAAIKVNVQPSEARRRLILLDKELNRN